MREVKACGTTNVLEKINLLYDRLKASAIAKSKMISYGTSCA